MKINVEIIVIAFQANDMLIIEIAAPQGYGEEILASFDGLIDSIKVETE